VNGSAPPGAAREEGSRLPSLTASPRFQTRRLRARNFRGAWNRGKNPRPFAGKARRSKLFEEGESFS
jgi:hypothetical protein